MAHTDESKEQESSPSILSLRTIERALETIREEQQGMKALLILLAKARRGQKMERLYEEVAVRNRMDIRQVIHFLGISRPWALHLMDILGKESGFKLIPGDGPKKIPTRVIFTGASSVQQQHTVIESLLSEKQQFTFNDIMEALNVDLTEAQGIAKEYCWMHKDVQIHDCTLSRAPVNS